MTYYPSPPCPHSPDSILRKRFAWVRTSWTLWCTMMDHEDMFTINQKRHSRKHPRIRIIIMHLKDTFTISQVTPWCCPQPPLPPKNRISTYRTVLRGYWGGDSLSNLVSLIVISTISVLIKTSRLSFSAKDRVSRFIFYYLKFVQSSCIVFVSIPGFQQARWCFRTCQTAHWSGPCHRLPSGMRCAWTDRYAWTWSGYVRSLWCHLRRNGYPSHRRCYANNNYMVSE